MADRVLMAGTHFAVLLLHHQSAGDRDMTDINELVLIAGFWAVFPYLFVATKDWIDRRRRH